MSGCGCGGGTGPGCGGTRAAAPGVVRDGAFTRPSFFDGQLLCADDLQALTAYTRGKDRLHNRYLVGTGVVCGLDVVCSRTDPGSVLVRAGYALDCCGNDIVLPCDQTVDINELIAGLPHDAGCVDPCPPPVPPPERGSEGKNSKPSPRRYELVVEYAETPEQLVSPYSSGEGGARGCEPTRYHEGYRFALRCGSDRLTAGDPFPALASCQEARCRLEGVEKATQAACGLDTRDLGPLAGPPANDEQAEAQSQLLATRELSQAVRLAGMAVRLAAAGGQTNIRRARGILGEVDRALGPVRETADRAADRDPITVAQAAALKEHLNDLGGRLMELKPTLADRLLAKGVVSGARIVDTVRSTILEIRDWALCWLEQHPGTRCRSMGPDLALLSVPGDDQVKLCEAGKVVTTAVRQILLDCVCAAANPPCASCEDAAVTLAVVAVRGCEVVEICNLVRQHVITGSALRWWLPITWAERELEQACCGGVDPRRLLDVSRGLRGVLADAAARATAPEARERAGAGEDADG